MSPIAGTTRDAIDTKFTWEGNDLTLIDTAGIRRSGKIQGSVEYYSVLRAQRAIERADVVVTVIDSIDGLLDGDKRVAGMAHERDAPPCFVSTNGTWASRRFWKQTPA